MDILLQNGDEACGYSSACEVACQQAGLQESAVCCGTITVFNAILTELHS
jgi:hypothetical protein